MAAEMQLALALAVALGVMAADQRLRMRRWTAFSTACHSVPSSGPRSGSTPEVCPPFGGAWGGGAGVQSTTTEKLPYFFQRSALQKELQLSCWLVSFLSGEKRPSPINSPKHATEGGASGAERSGWDQHAAKCRAPAHQGSGLLQLSEAMPPTLPSLSHQPSAACP